MIQFSHQIDRNLPALIAKQRERIQQFLTPNPINYVPSYNTLLLEFSPFAFHWPQLQLNLAHLLQPPLASCEHQVGKSIEIPTYYGAEVALDAQRYQQLSGLSLNQVQTLHTSVCYQVCALGFAAGFAFMAEVPMPLQLPRLPTPRPKVAKGSVAIAGAQTAIYPNQSPAGWNIIGRTPTSLYHPQSDPMTLLAPGDRVQFVAISKQQFIQLGGQL
ncbi:allophanate hydrolase subunit 1 [Vibrio rarus]